MRADWGTAAWFLEEAERLRALATAADATIAAKLIERAQQCELMACHLIDKKRADSG